MITRAQIRRQLRKNGGIMNVTPRQGYFLGKVVDVIKKPIKKVINVGKQVIKSPVGKAAILGLGGAGLMGAGPLGSTLGGLGARIGGGLAGLKGSLFGLPQMDLGIAGGMRGIKATPGILGKLGLTKGGGSLMPTVLGGLTAAGLTTYFMQKGKTEEEAEQLMQDVKRGEGLGLDIIKEDIKKYRSGALSGSQMFDKGYHFLLPREYIGAKGGRVGLANGSEGVKQMYVSDEAGALPKKMKDGEGGVLPSDMGKLKRNDFKSEADYKRYLRVLNKKAQGGRIGYQEGTPAVDPRMNKSLQENIAINKAQSQMNKDIRGIANTGATGLQFVKALAGAPGTITTGQMDETLSNIIQKKIQETGKLSGGIDYRDYGVETGSQGQHPYGRGEKSFASPEFALATTLGKADWSVDPKTGKVTWTGGTKYDFPKEFMGETVSNLINRGGIWSYFGGPKGPQDFSPDINVSQEFLKDYQPQQSELDRFKTAYDMASYGMPSEEVNWYGTGRPNYERILKNYQTWNQGPWSSDPSITSKITSSFGHAPGYMLAKGGRISKYGGGVMSAMPRIPMGMPRVNSGGVTELDYRQEGGFVPVGVKEKADDVPAMLSKNEFVMTADAVKGAGGGNVEKGAQRMYDTMKSLEKRIA